MKRTITGKYRHFKGKFYKVLGTALHSETREEMVIYKPLYRVSGLPKGAGTHPLFVRPKKMFFEKVMVDGKKVPRFKRVG